MSTIETINLTPTERIRIVYDESPECPRGDWHMLTGFVKIPGDGDSRLSDVPAVHDDQPVHTRIEYAHTAIEHETYSRDVEAQVVRWARIFWGLHIEYDSEHGGYWYVAGADAATAQTPQDTYSRCLFYDNWPDLVVGSPEHLAKQAEVIKDEREVYRQWADGEVYGVIHEVADTYARVERNTSDDTWELVNPLTEDDIAVEWVERESLWGIYQDDSETFAELAKKTAAEYFNLSDEARAAIDKEN